VVKPPPLLGASGQAITAVWEGEGSGKAAEHPEGLALPGSEPDLPSSSLARCVAIRRNHRP